MATVTLWLLPIACPTAVSVGTRRFGTHLEIFVPRRQDRSLLGRHVDSGRGTARPGRMPSDPGEPPPGGRRLPDHPLTPKRGCGAPPAPRHSRGVWYSSSPADRGLVLRAHLHHELRQVRGRCAEMCLHVGITKHITPHSMRVGGASEAAIAGCPGRLIMKQGRWRTEAVKDHYVRESLDQLLMVSRAVWETVT
jgi:hypothetical protein